jgi:hypothetical protein
MSRIPTITELELGNLHPTGLDEDFLARLTACADGTDVNLSEDEAAFETRLRALRPRTVPAALQTSLLHALGDAPFAVDGKIVLFNKPSSATVAAETKRSAFRFNVAAAAAVALLGSLAAFMVPAGTGKDGVAETAGAPVPVIAPAAVAAPPNIAPAGFSASPSETRDEGVIWRGKNQPHRVLRHTYMDEVLTMDSDGNPVTERRPRVEYEIIPEKID